MIDFIKIPEKRKLILEKNKKLKETIEKSTNTTITVNDDISIEGDGLEIFQTKQILKAFGRGFEINDCLSLLDDNYVLEIIDITEFTKSRKRLKILKSRIIGTGGKTKKSIENHSETKISIFGKTVSIIGQWNKASISKEAIMMIIDGVSHQTLYKWLERKRVKTW